MKSNVENFYVYRELGLATLNWTGDLSLANGFEVDLLLKVESKAKWTIMICVNKFWVVSADSDYEATITSISKKAEIRSVLKFEIASKGYKDMSSFKGKYGGIYSLRKVYDKSTYGIIMAIECDDCCHLMSIVYGRMAKLQSINSIVPLSKIYYNKDNIVTTVTATGTRGELIVGGWGWAKLITVKIK